MIVDITNEVLSAIKTALSTIPVLTSYPDTTPTFPLVTFEDLGNEVVVDTIDTSGENHNQVSFEINIFTNNSTKVSDARTIRNTIDGVMSGTYRMNRDLSQPTPNYLDNKVYRLQMRYSCKVDSNKKIYRG